MFVIQSEEDNKFQLYVTSSIRRSLLAFLHWAHFLQSFQNLLADKGTFQCL